MDKITLFLILMAITVRTNAQDTIVKANECNNHEWICLHDTSTKTYTSYVSDVKEGWSIDLYNQRYLYYINDAIIIDVILNQKGQMADVKGMFVDSIYVSMVGRKILRQKYYVDSARFEFLYQNKRLFAIEYYSKSEEDIGYSLYFNKNGLPEYVSQHCLDSTVCTVVFDEEGSCVKVLK